MKRFGVAHRLSAGLFAITLLTTLAAGLALYGIAQFREGFDRIATERLGNLVAVARLGQQAQAIAVSAPRLVASADRFERDRALRHLDDLFKQFALLFDDARLVGLDPTAVEGMKAHRQAFIDSLGRLNRLVADRQAGEQTFNARLTALDRLATEGRKAAGDHLAVLDHRGDAGQDGPAPFGGARAVLDWLSGFESGISTATLAAAATSEVGVNRIGTGFTAAVARAEAAAVRLPEFERGSLGPLLQRLRGLALGSDGVFETRRTVLAANRQIQGALNRINIVSGQFVAAGSNLFADAQGVIEQDRAGFTHLMNRGANALAMIVIGSLAAAALVFLYLRLRVIRRLLDLQRCMRAHADGTAMPIPTQGTDELGDMARAFAFFVGEIERRERELRAAKEQAEAAFQELKATQEHLVATEKMAALGGLVAGIAHEINTPIGVALTGASYVQDRSKELAAQTRDGKLRRSDLERYLQQIGDTAHRILFNIDRAVTLIQSFKQVAADQTQDERRRFVLARSIGDIVASFEPRLRAAGVAVRVECPETLEVDGYPGAMFQVLSNLIMNSLIHAFSARAGGGTLALLVRADGSDQVELRFVDDGRGMTPEVLARVFEPFFTTRRGQGGTGLGLHIVHNIVSKTMGGRIMVQSDPGRGTTFAIRFPTTAPQMAEGPDLVTGGEAERKTVDGEGELRG